MEAMRFIFSGFWIWLGVLILVCGILNGVAEIVKAFRKQKSVKVTNFKDGMSLVEVTGLAPEEFERVIAAAKEGRTYVVQEGETKEKKKNQSGPQWGNLV